MKHLSLFVLIFCFTTVATFGQCNCSPLPPPAPNETVVYVNNMDELTNAIKNVSGKTTIFLNSGTYNVNTSRFVYINRPNVTIRSTTGNRNDVIIQGTGMTAQGTVHGICVMDSNITVADLTVKEVSCHAFFVNYGVNNCLFHNVRGVDCGQQILKATGYSTQAPKNDGIIECSTFEYTTTLNNGTTGSLAGWYTNGIDLLNCHRWIIRDNVFRNIKHNPSVTTRLAGPAILLKSGSSNTIVERNKIIECDFGISFGNDGDEEKYSHSGGIIRNNFIIGYSQSDFGIGVVRSPNTKVINNTVYSPGGRWAYSIEAYRAETSNCIIMNNLCDEPILSNRDGASSILTTNNTNATANYFVDVTKYDLHLKSNTLKDVINAGTQTSDRETDIDCQNIIGNPDIGADEYSSDEIIKTSVVSIKRTNNAAERTNADTIMFAVTLEQNADYTPIASDFGVKNGSLILNNPISGSGTEWSVKVATNESSGYDTAKTVSLNLSAVSKLKASANMISETYNVRKKFIAKINFISPSNTDVCLTDTGKAIFNEDGIIINSEISPTIVITGGDGNAKIKDCFIRDIDPNDHKSELIFTYSNIKNAITYNLSLSENCFIDMWGNLSGKSNVETKFNTVKAFVHSIERFQPVTEKTNADTVSFKLTLEKVVDYTPEKSDFLFQNCNLVQNNGIVGSGSEWQIKVLTNVSDGYDSAKLVTIHLLPEGNFYSVKSFKPQNYSVRKKFVSNAVLESPSGDSVAINGTDGKIIFTEKDISLSTVTPTLTLSGGIGTVSELKILEEEKSTSLLFSYSGLSNSTQYSLEFSANALKDSWGNLSNNLSLSSNIFTTCKEVGINSDLSLFSLSNQPNPFTHSTFITWSSSIAADSKIIVFDITGKLVRILLDEYRLAGEHSLVFDSKGLEPGIYYYQIQIGKEVSAKKMLIVK